MELISRARVLTAKKRPRPATSRRACGFAVPIPTFDRYEMKSVGVRTAAIIGKDRAATPASKTIFPVVWRRI